MEEASREIDDKVNAAESCVNSKSFQDAIDLFLDIIDFFTEVGNFEKKDTHLIKINECYELLAKQFEEHQDYFEAAETYCSAAFLQKQHEKLEQARQLFNAAINCFILAGKKALTEKAYIEASRLYCSAAMYAKSENQDELKATEYYQTAIDAIQKEMEIHPNHDDPPSICQTHMELGKIYEFLGEYQKALSQYNNVIDCSTKTELFTFTAECFQHMATCYECLGNQDEMEVCLNKAVNYRLQEADKFSKNDLPLEAVQNFIVAANCVARLDQSDELLKTIIQNEADCFLTVAQDNIERGQILQAAYYERNAAYCLNQLGQSEVSIDLFLAAAEKCLSIHEYYGAANNFQDASLYQERVGNLLKAANYAIKAASIANEMGDLEFAIPNFVRAAQIFQKIGYFEKANYSYSQLAECFVTIANFHLKSKKYHLTAFFFFKAATSFSNLNDENNATACYERAIKNYEKAIDIAIRDDERLLASYSACCATLVCLIMQQPARAEVILNEIRDDSPNNYYHFSNSIIRAFKAKDSEEYDAIHQKYYKIIQNSSELRNMFDLTMNSA